VLPWRWFLPNLCLAFHPLPAGRLEVGQFVPL
jgi:hypothetical protein